MSIYVFRFNTFSGVRDPVNKLYMLLAYLLQATASKNTDKVAAGKVK